MSDDQVDYKKMWIHAFSNAIFDNYSEMKVKSKSFFYNEVILFEICKHYQF